MAPSGQDIQAGVATVLALKQLYDTFYPKKEEPKEEKPTHIVIDQPSQINIKDQENSTPSKQELRKNAYIGMKNLQLYDGDLLNTGNIASR